MDPYYQDDAVTLYLGDCREVTAWLAADVLVMDPPYGIAIKQRLGDARHVRKQMHILDVIEGDESAALRDEVLDMWGRGPAIVFGSWRIARPLGVRSLLVWDKRGANSGPLNAAFFTSHEEIYVIGEGWVKSADPQRSVIATRESRPTVARQIGHPTPKPVGLMETLLSRCSPGVIADPTAGVCSTLVAAKQLGRKAIGVEIDERYCEIAAKRLSQGVLDFDTKEAI
jgi:site-specific DNA-methyltransferase (adenine-specific)